MIQVSQADGFSHVGILLVYTTMRSDLIVKDRTQPESDQKVRSQSEWNEAMGRMQVTAAGIVDPRRSSLTELPVIWPDLGTAGLVSTGSKMQINAQRRALPEPEGE